MGDWQMSFPALASFSLEYWTRARITTRATRPKTIFRGFDLTRWLDGWLDGPRAVVHVLDSLDDRDPRCDCQDVDDDCQRPTVECQPERRLRRGQEHDALGSLQHAHLRVQAERFGAGA